CHGRRVPQWIPACAGMSGEIGQRVPQTQTSCAGLTRASTSYSRAPRKTWMAGTRPAMTVESHSGARALASEPGMTRLEPRHPPLPCFPFLLSFFLFLLLLLRPFDDILRQQLHARNAAAVAQCERRRDGKVQRGVEIDQQLIEILRRDHPALWRVALERERLRIREHRFLSARQTIFVRVAHRELAHA